jgi:pimeloyl-ACP methyl ester carboxylesterase
MVDEVRKLREGYAEVGDQQLHYVETGDGPLVVLLHGFPEFSYGWRHQIRPLAAAGFRVVAPDMRGYNLSSKPESVTAYDTGQLTADISGLIHERGAESAMLVGHDWGGSVAWATAMQHPDVVDRLAILNAAHPRKLSQGLHHQASSGDPGISSSLISQSYLNPSSAPTTGTSSGTFCATPAPALSPSRTWNAISRRGRSQAQLPG